MALRAGLVDRTLRAHPAPREAHKGFFLCDLCVPLRALRLYASRDCHWHSQVVLNRDVRGEVQALALSSSAMSAALSFSSTAFTMSCNCSKLVALAIGAVTLGRAISHASATCAGVALCRAPTSSSALSTAWPRSLRYFFTPPPRGLLPRSASDRYLPVRNPAANA